MKALALLFLFISYNAKALEAVVTVLEAPLFKEMRLDAPVVQYVRKGEIIKLHKSLGNTTKYDHLAPSGEKIKEWKKKLEERPEWRDPMFKDGKERTTYIEDEFLPCMDRQGNVVYVLSEHIYVYFDDSREFAQTIPKKDPTDYRLEEPLPKTYPLISPTGSRGQILFGFSQASNESYDYPSPVKTKGYSNPLELSIALQKRASHDTTDRFFFGGNVRFRAYNNQFSFFDFHTSQERYFQFGIGPLISYDAYKGEENRLSLAFSININPLNNLTITQFDDSTKDVRTYKSINFSSRLGIQYHRKKIVGDLDFILGTSLDLESPASYQAQNGGSQSAWWQKLGGEHFETKGYFTLTGFMGLQVAN